RNRNRKQNLRELSKAVTAAAEAGDVDQLKSAAREAEKRYDQAASKGRVHPNLVARKKSQLRRLIKEKTGDLPKK
ncbi:MAG TPA: 30S ribosomal protein S20, partial [Gemmatales bacterium]|nr:30S ribosomal protein S20 [Gemmatales bacterium]